MLSDSRGVPECADLPFRARFTSLSNSSHLFLILLLSSPSLSRVLSLSGLLPVGIKKKLYVSLISQNKLIHIIHIMIQMYNIPSIQGQALPYWVPSSQTLYNVGLGL
ncbi:viral protein RNase Z [Temperate fruit decay-associated virus]|uniref:Viral protein RNase Z n=1 Tax=Temperate fruit decay-associated virus TaxID=1628899 RepID=A0A0K0TNV7_9VIRU|nr:viral protein RNase Z [Temperate fruit decay-associated virus]AKR53164.1 viral protein RNase Z [Temperate fruit decay-associated virus]AKR53167.1 viral protein RNase Z [Temperate fruit decay-associated virus]AKR53204.1 viral protein RNase Z [Temperate fruit decay-associated virus]AKR53208.1 viral protein RNase Z [Temperate fruit decay-associated virus]